MVFILVSNTLFAKLGNIKCIISYPSICAKMYFKYDQIVTANHNSGLVPFHMMVTCIEDSAALKMFNTVIQENLWDMIQEFEFVANKKIDSGLIVECKSGGLR